MMDVCLIGTGGMMPLPGRRLTSLYARTGGHALVIDCGEGTQTGMRECGLSFKAVDDMLFTHYHADHISGLPGFLLTMGNSGRTEALTMHGPRGLERVVSALRVIVPELPFEIVYHEYDESACAFPAGGFRVDAFHADHGMPCYGYALSLSRSGQFDANRARALGIPVEYWKILQKGERTGGFSPEDVLGEPRKGLKLVYVTDTRPTDRIIAQLCGCDLCVLEGMFGEAEKHARAEITRHMTMQEAARMALDAGAAELWLTHYSPATPHPEEFAAEIRSIFPNTRFPADGEKIALRFENRDLQR